MDAKSDKSANTGTNINFAHSGSGADSVVPPLDSLASRTSIAGGDTTPARSFTHDNAPNERISTSEQQQLTQNEFLEPTPQKQQPSRAAKTAHPFSAPSKSLFSTAKSSAKKADVTVRESAQTPHISPLAQAALHSGSRQTVAARQTLSALKADPLFPILSPHLPTRSEPPTAPPSTQSEGLSLFCEQQPQAPVPTSSPPRHRSDDTDPEPLHTSAAARLQHDIAQAVAISAAMHPDPVGQPISFSRNPSQLTYWKQLFLELSSRRSILTPAEELHLHLLTELLCLHQESVERGRALDHAHMQQAADIINAIKPGTHASRPVIISSQSPTAGLIRQSPAMGQQIVANAPVSANSDSPATLHDVKQRINTQQMVHTWLAPAQQAGATAAHAKQEQLRQEHNLYRKQQQLLADEAQDLACIRAADRRIKQRQEVLQRLQAGVPEAVTPTSAPPPAPASTDATQATRQLSIRVRAPTASRTQELRIAALTGDDDLLRHGSDRVKSEDRSEDEAGAVLAEVDQHVAAEHLFYPKKLVKFTDKNGYVLNSFVVPDNSVDDMPSDRSVSRSSGRPSETDTSHYTDGDSSSDYKPSPYGSTSPSARRSISAREWEEFQAFKQAQQLPHGGRQQPNGPPTYNISIAEPPEHGDWRDINHLTTVFKDKHVKYINRCGQGQHLSVWECYTETARQCIMEHLTAISTDPTDDFSADYMSSLTDDELYALLQDQLGISYDVEAETALRAITFQGSILEVSNWVVFRTAWSQVLNRVTSAGTIQPRRLAELFRNSIPDDFMRSWLNARKHLTWTEAYTAALGALKDTKWHTHYSKHLIATTAAVPRTPVDPKVKNSPIQLQHQLPKPPVSKEATHAAPINTTQARDKTPFDPLKFRTRKGGFNVNPNLKSSDYWENADKTLCSRCDLLHRWNPDACTADKNSAGEKITPPLTAQEFAIRLKKRWDRGFFFSKQIAEYKSPSAQDSAQKAASATSKLQQNPNTA